MFPPNLCTYSKTAPAYVAEAPDEIISGRDLSSSFRISADCKISFIFVKACSCSSKQAIFRFLALSEPLINFPLRILR